jgi:two-component system, sensor histidine kinase
MSSRSPLWCEGARLLIVDDDRAVLEATLDMAEALGAVAVGAESVDRARPLLAEFDPTLVLADFYMPDGGARAVLAAVQAWKPSIPVVLFTGAHDLPRDGRFAATLLKPARLETLASCIRTLGLRAT